MGFSSDGEKRSSKFQLTLFAAVGLLLVKYCSCHVGDSCDWSGSGWTVTGAGSSPQERGVQPLYLRCRQGRISWRYPSGALRVLLRLQGTDKEFRACLRPGTRFQGARIYLEGHRRLHLLYSPSQDEAHNEVVSSGPDRKVRCFASVQGQAALYVEATPPVGRVPNLKKVVAEFAYDLQPLSKDDLHNDLEECRPCTDEELIQYFCSSDYVMVGTVSSLWHDSAQERSEVQVRALRVHRDSHTRPISTASHEADDSYVRKATLYRPIKCGTKFGSGQFLFMARRFLGDPYITCAPRLDNWKVLRRKAIQEGSSPCLLD